MTAGRAQLDQLAVPALLDVLLDGEAQVLPAVRAVGGAMTSVVEAAADQVRAGGRLVFVGAGTSGRLAMAEAAELPGTFGVDPSSVVGLIAGDGADGAEDDGVAGASAVDRLNLTGVDALVAVTASGRTPYTRAAASSAQARGALTVAVTTTPGSPLGTQCDLAVEVDIGPEVLRGSTRMAAGTAQKIVLNVVTTAVMVAVGRVHGDLMIDVVAANAKLRGRTAGIVAEIAGVSQTAADAALIACRGNARAAVLSLVGGLEPAVAVHRAAEYPSLRTALADLPVRMATAPQ